MPRETVTVNPRSSSETEWLASFDVEKMLACLPADVPVNLVGRSARSLALHFRTRLPDLQLVPLATTSLGESPPLQAGSSDADWDRLADALARRSSTVILDPLLGHRLAQAPLVLERIGLKTFDRLVFPAFIQPAPFQVLYSDGFSFEEPVNDDLTMERWCWNTSEKQSFVLVQANDALTKHWLRFSLSGASFGTFICRVGDQVQACSVAGGDLTAKFAFRLEQASPIVRIDIAFNGAPLLPQNPQDQRKVLYYSYGGTSIEPIDPGVQAPTALPPPAGVAFLPDRAVRRSLHAYGFFQVTTLATPFAGLSSLVGVRSCFDYRCGFSFRDTDPATAAAPGGPAKHYAFPAIWYEARRMPTPGSEWIGKDDQLALAVGWSPQASVP